MIQVASSRGRSRQKSRSPQRPSTQPHPRSRSARSTDSKRSNKSDKTMDAPVSKGCSSITGKRVLVIKGEIENKGLQTVDMSGQGLTFVPLPTFNSESHLINFKVQVRGHGGRVVTLSPPTSEARVQFPARPQVGKLVVACHWSTVYSTEP